MLGTLKIESPTLKLSNFDKPPQRPVWRRGKVAVMRSVGMQHFWSKNAQIN